MNTNIQTNLKKLPDAPGIYLFYNSKRKLIYVGKATSLKDRVRSYFTGSSTMRPIEQMIHEVSNIKCIKTDSVLEAIILEGNYIKKYRPKYNIDWKDDKSWNYIVITKDDYPRVETIRQHELDQVIASEAKQSKQRCEIASSFSTPRNDFKHIFGPFPGVKKREMMKILQRLFYISICKPNAKRACLYNQMGQCLGVCTGEISVKDYREKVIKPLVMFLRGNKKRLILNLKNKMKESSKEQNYEEAARLRNQIKALQRIQDVVLLSKNFFKNDFQKTKNKKQNLRIEGYDISNFGANDKVGSMVVFSNGEPDKKQYRKFKIKTVVGQSDVDCLAEIIERRLRHDEWSLSDLFLIDGGKPQVNRVSKVLKVHKVKRPVVGIAKGVGRKKNEFVFASKKPSRDLILWVNKNKELLIIVRDEAHRFAITYQKQLRKIS